MARLIARAVLSGVKLLTALALVMVLTAVHASSVRRWVAAAVVLSAAVILHWLMRARKPKQQREQATWPRY